MYIVRSLELANWLCGQGYKILKVEDSEKTELIISNYASPLVSLIPDDVTIRYEEVVRCEATVKTGETKDDIVAHVLEIGFMNGTVLGLGFLCV